MLPKNNSFCPYKQGCFSGYKTVDPKWLIAYNICIVKIKEQKMVGLTVVEGDVIRAYDFKPMTGREDCFVEGQVIDAHNTEQGYQAYKIRVTRDSWSDAEDAGRVGIEIFVPWRVSFSEFQGRVMNLSR
jgi:hypothetical protein